jgi:hypothetical protein
LYTPSANETDEFDGRVGYLVITFSIESAGTYTASDGYPGGPVVTFFIFALGKSTSGPFIVTGFRSLVA